MADLPRGTVTFLFSDIEGSTRLLTRLRAAYAEVLAEHQRLLRAAFDEHDGREVKTEGDAFFVAFARARDAVAAAVSAQRALASRRWPDGADVRVRIGVHTGEAELRLDDYVGLDVHRAARICSAGHGGQVLISSTTRELVAGDLPPDVALSDLGEHRLKDLDRPEHLFQLVVGDLPADFPPPASIGSDGANGLPPAPNRTIGRAEDVRAIAERLGPDGVRLLTLTGPGGVGKTRLSLEAARAAKARFADGARFVDLAAVQRPQDVPAAIVKTLAIVVLSGESAEQAAERFLAAKHLLLVVDNFEHLPGAAPFVARLLDACPGLTVLATSRQPLDLRAEERYPVSPLALPARTTPEDAHALGGVEAIALFCERARAHEPAFDLDDANAGPVAEICRRVDGLPLAIELAAARCGLLSPDEIAERLRETLAALGSGARDAPVRHRTLRATIDWSHELLTDTEQQCFARFAVFAGGATVPAAETITRAGLDTLEGLVAKSLLVRGRHGHTSTRLGMLDTIHAYAAERFASASAGDVEAVRDEHYRHYLALAQRHGTERALWGAGGKDHLAVLDAEVDNLHAALAWAIEQASAGRALAMAAALSRYWLTSARYADALYWADQALNLPGADAHPADRVRVLCTKAMSLWPQGRGAEIATVLAAAESVARGLGDPLVLCEMLRRRVLHEINAERLAVADAIADEALQLATAAGDEWEIAQAARGKAIAASSLDELRERVDRAASLLDDVGNVDQLAELLTSAAYAALCLGGERAAADFAARAAPIARALGSAHISMVNSGNLGLAALLLGETDAARDAFRQELALCRDMVVRLLLFEALRGLAAVAVVDGHDTRAATLVGAAEAHRYHEVRDPVEARLDETFFDPARTRCGADAWDAATREGSRLGFEDAVAYALQERRA